MKITINEYNYTYMVDLRDDTTCDEFMETIMELAGNIYHEDSIEKYLKDNIERKWLENRMVNGSLQSEYEKPYKFKTFTINE